MKYVVIMLVASMFLAMGAAQPEEPPAVEPALDENSTNQSDIDDVDEVNESEEVEENESEEVEEPGPDRERDRDQDRARQGTASFDARLQTAISTLDALTEIAPSEEAQNGIEEALTTLEGVQNSTDTASLGPEERPGEDRDQERERDQDRDKNQTSENETGQRGPPEDAGPGDRGPSGDSGPDNRGPSENSNRPGFVEDLIGGIFG